MNAATLTTILAIWGAVLSTITVIWNLHRDRRDRASLKVTALVKLKVQDSYGQLQPLKDLAGDGHDAARCVCVLELTATNVGRRTVLVIGWGTTARNSTSTFVPTVGPPDKLAEGEYRRVIVYDPLSSALNDPVKDVFVRDSTGRDWNLARKRLKSLRQEARRLIARTSK